MNSGNFYGSVIRHGIFFPGEGTPLFGLYGYVPLNRVWFSRSWVLNRVYNFTIERLEQGVFLDWKPFKECEDLRWAVYICNTNNFFLNICFHDFSVKNYLILYAKQINQGQKVVFRVLICLKQGSEISNFCPKQGRGLNASAAGTPLPKLPLSAPRAFFWRINFGPGSFLGFWLKP